MVANTELTKIHCQLAILITLETGRELGVLCM